MGGSTLLSATWLFVMFFTLHNTQTQRKCYKNNGMEVSEKMKREFSEILHELRKQRGLRIKDVSIATGISENALSYYETGKGYPTAPFICWLADYFGVTTDYLLGRKDDGV